MNFEPLERVIEHAQAVLGMSWQEVEYDLDHGHITPAQNQPGKVRIVGSRVDAIAVDQDPMLVLYVRERRAPDLDNHTPVVGVERPRRLPRQRGGGHGNRWATSFPELIKLAERNNGVRVVQGSKHYLVLKDGTQVASLPLTASDHRSLMNASKQLDNLGIDVRRSM